MSRSWPRAVARPRTTDDGGFALLVVIGVVFATTLLIAASTTLASSARASRASQVAFTQALDAAESGVDSMVATLQTCPSCTVGPDLPSSVATGGWASSSAEHAWAVSTLTSLANSGSLVTVPGGQYVAIRPASAMTIYSMGWAPSFAHPLRARVMKARYTLGTAAITKGLLAQGNVAIGGGFTISQAAGTSQLPDVHSNGNLSGTATLSYPAGTAFTASGTDSYSSTGASQPTIPVPSINPRTLYNSQAGNYSGKWFDLCPDGFVRQPNPGNTPCTGTLVTTPSGWSFSSGTWNEAYPAGPSGVYYAYRSAISVNAGGNVVNQTLITESAGNLTCPNLGDATVSVSKATVNGYLPGVVLYSGGSVTIGTQGATIGGLVGAQQDVSITTGSAPGITGYVIADNLCGGSNSFQGSNIAFAPAPTPALPGTVAVFGELEI